MEERAGSSEREVRGAQEAWTKLKEPLARVRVGLQEARARLKQANEVLVADGVRAGVFSASAPAP